MQCPCGTNLTFKKCCQPFINGTQKPNTAEQLMRSRFSAYATKHSAYIAQTYAKQEQSAHLESEINEWAKQTCWVKLTIVDTDYQDSSEHFVEFKAEYIHDNALCVLHERSRFIQESGDWRYIDGDIKTHDTIKELTRNSPCPCGSGKKYKRCCQ